MPTAALLMLKAPRAGFVKTRLAAEIGAEAARDAYRQMVERQIREIPPDWQTIVHFTPADGAAEMKHWLGQAPAYLVQPDGDLGARMGAALIHAWECGCERAVLLGGDCPWITGGLLRSAERALETHDLVIGPARDGGYYLLGANAGICPPFENIAWSTEHVLAQTLALARQAGTRFALLPELEDVDAAASWGRAKAVLRAE